VNYSVSGSHSAVPERMKKRRSPPVHRSCHITGQQPGVPRGSSAIGVPRRVVLTPEVTGRNPGCAPQTDLGSAGVARRGRRMLVGHRSSDTSAELGRKIPRGTADAGGYLGRSAAYPASTAASCRVRRMTRIPAAANMHGSG
jgi:hypothetical protein